MEEYNKVYKYTIDIEENIYFDFGPQEMFRPVNLIWRAESYKYHYRTDLIQSKEISGKFRRLEVQEHHVFKI